MQSLKLYYIDDKYIDYLRQFDDNGTLGIVNINNMIPTPFNCLIEILPTITDQTYKILLEKQLTYLNNHKKALFSKVKIFYEKYQKGYLPNHIKNRCCNLTILEQKCLDYCQKDLSLVS